MCLRGGGLADSLVRSSDKPHEAIAVLQEGLLMPAADAHPLLLTSLSRIKAVVQSAARSLPALQEFQPETDDPVLLAELYASTSETAKAFRHLDEAADRKHYRLS